MQKNERVFQCFIPISLTVLILLIPSPFLNAQHTPANDARVLRARLNKNIHAAVDSAVIKQQSTIDSLSHALEGSLRRQTLSLKTLADSLSSSAQDVMNHEAIVSANQLYNRFSGNLKILGQAQRQSLSNQLTSYKRTIAGIARNRQACQTCATPGDFEQALNQFQEEKESSTDTFLETTESLYEEASSALADSAEIFRDSLTTFVETLAERRSSELDSIETHSNKIIVSIDGSSHTSFRGRDGGVSQASLSPSVTLHLTSGIRFSLGAGWTEKPEFHRDGASAGVGCNFTFLSVLGGSIGYSYLWFTDSSTQNQSVFHHSLDGSLFLETAVVNIGTDIGISIGSETEYAIAASISRSLPLGKFSLNPSLIVSWGEQNGALVEQRVLKADAAKGKSAGKGNGKGNSGGGQQSSGSTIATSTTPNNVFSIMSYEVHVPLNIQLGRILFTPSLTAVVPVNILDGSRSVPFVNAKLTATFDWIW